jgi:hypothetical protein
MANEESRETIHSGKKLNCDNPICQKCLQPKQCTDTSYDKMATKNAEQTSQICDVISKIAQRKQDKMIASKEKIASISTHLSIAVEPSQKGSVSVMQSAITASNFLTVGHRLNISHEPEFKDCFSVLLQDMAENIWKEMEEEDDDGNKMQKNDLEVNKQLDLEEDSYNERWKQEDITNLRFDSQLHYLAYDDRWDDSVLSEHKDNYISMFTSKIAGNSSLAQIRKHQANAKKLLKKTKENREEEIQEVNLLHHCANPYFINDYLQEAQTFSRWWHDQFPSLQEYCGATLQNIARYSGQSLVGDFPISLFDRLVGIFRLTSINECYNTHGSVSDDDIVLLPNFKVSCWTIKTSHLKLLACLFSEVRNLPFQTSLLSVMTHPGFKNVMLVDILLRWERLMSFSWCFYFNMSQPDVKYGFPFIISKLEPNSLKNDVSRFVPTKITLQTGFLMTLPCFYSLELNPQKNKKDKKKKVKKHKNKNQTCVQ